MLARFAREGDFGCFLLAGRSSILEQGARDELFPLWAQKNIGIFPGGTYNGGVLASDPNVGAKFNFSDASTDVLERARRLRAVAARHRVSLKAAAWRFALAHQAGPRQSPEPSLTVGLLNRFEAQVRSPRVSKGSTSTQRLMGLRRDPGLIRR